MSLFSVTFQQGRKKLRRWLYLLMTAASEELPAGGSLGWTFAGG
jgi:hypothetical protein